MLHCDLHLPAEPSDHAPLIVLLHGRGADERDLAALRPRLPARSILALPRAPFRGAPWGYGDGWAWYRFLGDTRVDVDSFRESQAALAALLADLPGRLPVAPGPLILGGFSQGGTISLAHALLRPGSVPHVVNMSGFLADHPDVRATPETVAGTRIWWGHGTADPVIPHLHAIAGRAALTAAGADLAVRDYAMGHGIVPAELADVVDWLRRGGVR